MQLTTHRLRVRPFVPADEAALHALLSSPAVMEYLEPPFAPAQTHAFLQAALGPRPPVYAVEALADGAFVGYLIFHPYPEQPFADFWELGWVLAQQHWGRGYAAELTEAVIAHAQRQGIPGLVLECVPEQAATRRLAAKLGFAPAGQAEGLLRFCLTL